MTVTQRRVRTEPGKADAPLGELAHASGMPKLTEAVEPGIKYTCDACELLRRSAATGQS